MARQARAAVFPWLMQDQNRYEAQLAGDEKSDFDMRLRRAAYRAAHRGTKEMDALVGRFAEARLTSFDDAALEQFERFLAIADPTLQAWIFGNESTAGSEFEHLVDEIRSFHGLGSAQAQMEWP